MLWGARQEPVSSVHPVQSLGVTKRPLCTGWTDETGSWRAPKSMPSSTPSSLQESLKFEGDPARGSLDPRSSGSRPSSVGTLSMADDPRNLNAFRFGTSRIPADPVLQFRLHVCPGADPARRCRYRSRSDKFHSRWNARRPLVPTAVRARARADLS